jgi:hypothetical protein
MRLSLLLLVLSACQPPTPPVPPPGPDAADAAPATPCQTACNALAAAGCPEGKMAVCVTTLAAIEARREVRTSTGAPLTCVALTWVRTPADAQAMGIGCSP